MEIQNHGSQVSQVAKDKDATVDGSHGKAVSEVVNNTSVRHVSRQLMNQAILSAQEQVTISSGDKPMQLLYRTAIDAINQKLKASMGETAFQQQQQQQVDYSPEATAGRIVDFATKFYTTYQQQNADKSPEDQLNGFMDIIGGAIDKGFSEARNILDKLKVLDGDIADGVDATYSHVQKGLQAFRDSFTTSEQ
ncbi:MULTISPECIES: DUF5610 domain-containing protein [unclassified Shewanella]|jgi:hypothetical protein|uniref:DUF5610 domain-containing protein n=1 Tax=unclassified Shewanella TaxID=196818 RepID=UPI001A97E4BC|nr:DUF5610 domain-containing protein [Shewanella sp. 4t3-1-2LB]MBO1271875.1 DUF5610 domain-containing protein [Shewanella sp. 4t3-1-2LB]